MLPDLLNPKTILVVQIGKIGDMILTTPLFSGLKKVFPDSRLIVLASRINQEIPASDKNVDEVIVYKKNLLANLTGNFRRVDLWIDTKREYSKTSALIKKLFKPKVSMGFNSKGKIFDYPLNEINTGRHAVDINLSPLTILSNSIKLISRRPVIGIADKLSVKGLTKNGLLINISAGNPSRYLETEEWINAIKTIRTSEAIRLTLTGLDKDRSILDSIKNGIQDNTIEIFVTKNIADTIAIVSDSRIVITPDTSIVHVCSALNKAVVALYPDVEWNYERFKPLSDNFEVVFSKDSNSLKGITGREIAEAFLKLASRINPDK